MAYFPERRHPRVEFQQTPWVFSLRLSEAASPDKPFRLEARNVSPGGLKFLCNRRFTLFETLEIDLFDRQSGKALPAVLGKVVRVEEIDTGYGERTYGVAIEFVSGTEALAAALPTPSSPSAPGK